MRLDDVSVLVTGGAGGLGEAAVRQFHQAGASVVVADLADDRASKLADELGERAAYARTDVNDDAAVGAAIEAASAMAPLRAVVVAHGGWGVSERIVGRDGTPAPIENFRKMLELYLVGTYNVVRLGAAAMARTEPLGEDGGRGAIVTTASIAGIEGQTGQSAYASAKGGVIGLTLVAARDLSPVGVRVCCIAPGTMRTPIMEAVGDEKLAAFARDVPFPKRLGKPEEYGKLARHIAENDYLNGEIIRLDGAQRFGLR